MSKITDEVLLLRYKKLNWDDARIAAKMGWKVEEVAARWMIFVKSLTQKEENGHDKLCQVAHVMADQFQLLGQSIGILSEAIGQKMDIQDLRAIIEACPIDEDMASWVSRKALVLRNFCLPSPEQIAQKLLEAGRIDQN